MQEMNERRFLRFTGKLWETDEFEPGIGWETARIARRPASAPGFTLQLLDGSDGVLVEAGVEFSEPICRTQGASGMTTRRVVGYLPFHPQGREVVFRRGERLLYRTSIAAAPPQIGITGLEIDSEGCVRLQWAVEHDRPIRFDLVFVDGQHRKYLIASEQPECEFKFQTAGLPGGPGCTIAVLATDGLRSAWARSEPFDLPEQPPRLVILMPEAGATLMPDQPISLLGLAQDGAGQSLSDEGLVWSVNGTEVARGQRMAHAELFETGPNHIELAYIPGSGQTVRETVTVYVAERTMEQVAWRAIANSLPSSARSVGNTAADEPARQAPGRIFKL